MNSEKKIDNYAFVLKLGTTDKNNPRTFYVNGRTFLIPELCKKNYNDDLDSIIFKFKKRIQNMLMNCDELNNKFIVNFDIASDRMKKDKSSSFFFEIYMSQRNNELLPLNTLYERTSQFFNEMYNGFAYDLSLNYFKTSKTKIK